MNLESVGPNDCRVRKGKVTAADELRFSEEEMPISLSKRDARRLVGALDRPPRPNAAARRAAKRVRKTNPASKFR
jgi:uncharacterized protein (DUF1778 family)